MENQQQIPAVRTVLAIAWLNETYPNTNKIPILFVDIIQKIVLFGYQKVDNVASAQQITSLQYNILQQNDRVHWD